MVDDSFNLCLSIARTWRSLTSTRGSLLGTTCLLNVRSGSTGSRGHWCAFRRQLRAATGRYLGL